VRGELEDRSFGLCLSSSARASISDTEIQRLRPVWLKALIREGMILVVMKQFIQNKCWLCSHTSLGSLGPEGPCSPPSRCAPRAVAMPDTQAHYRPDSA